MTNSQYMMTYLKMHIGESVTVWTDGVQFDGKLVGVEDGAVHLSEQRGTNPHATPPLRVVIDINHVVAIRFTPHG